MDKLQGKRLCICILQASSQRNVFAGNGVSPEQFLGFANLPFQSGWCFLLRKGGALPSLPFPAQVLEHAFSGHRWMSTPVVSALGLRALFWGWQGLNRQRCSWSNASFRSLFYEQQIRNQFDGVAVSPSQSVNFDIICLGFTMLLPCFQFIWP